LNLSHFLERSAYIHCLLDRKFTTQAQKMVPTHSRRFLEDSHMGETPLILPRRPVPEFLFQLTQMLSDPSNHHLIEWSGRCIVVHDPVNLEKEVLQKYFRHSKYSSFQRQMNYFGFRKNAGKCRMSPCTYENEAVAPGDLSGLLSIKRKTQGSALPSAKKNTKVTKLKQELSNKTHAVIDNESHETPNVPLSLHIAGVRINHDNAPHVVTAEENNAAPDVVSPLFPSSNVLVEQPPLVVSPPSRSQTPPTPLPITCFPLNDAIPSSEPTAEEMFAHHQHNVPNPLLASSHPSLPSPLLLSTSEVKDKISNDTQGDNSNLSGHFVADITLGIFKTSGFLTTTLPPSDTIFPSLPRSSSLVSVDEDGNNKKQKNSISLSPSSSLVDLAMLPFT